MLLYNIIHTSSLNLFIKCHEVSCKCLMLAAQEQPDFCCNMSSLPQWRSCCPQMLPALLLQVSHKLTECPQLTSVDMATNCVCSNLAEEVTVGTRSRKQMRVSTIKQAEQNAARRQEARMHAVVNIHSLALNSSCGGTKHGGGMYYERVVQVDCPAHSTSNK